MVDQALQVRELEVGRVVRQVDRRLPVRRGGSSIAASCWRVRTLRTVAGRHDHRRRDDAARGLRRGLQVGDGHAAADRLAPAARPAAREAGERVDDHLRRRLLREHVADRPRHDRDAEAAGARAAPRGAASRPVCATRESSYCERGVVDARRRRPVAPEEPQREPPVAAERRETPAPARRLPRPPRANRRSLPARGA